MTFREMVKNGVKFTSGGAKVTITDTDVFISDTYSLMLAVLEDGSYQLFDPENGKFVQYNGFLHRDSTYDLVPVPVEKEGWFGIVHVSHRKIPVMSGIYETQEECVKNVEEIFKGTRYETHKIIYTV